MASYMITAKNNSGESLATVQISAIQQDAPVVEEIAVVNAVREFMRTLQGVGSVSALKYEQVITNV